MQLSNLILLLLLCTVLLGNSAAINIYSFIPRFYQRNLLKRNILSSARKLQRGLTGSSVDNDNIISLIKRLEKLRPSKSKSALISPYLDGVWNLEYTSGEKLLGKNSLHKRIGNILQILNVKKLTAENKETVKYFGVVPVTQSFTADLSILSPSKVSVTFKKFQFGPITIPAPPNFVKGTLEITYLDKDFRLSRGDKGSVFVLTKLNP